MTIEYVDGFDRANTNTSMALRGWTVTGTFAAATGRNSQGSALKNTTGGGWEAYLDLPGGNLATRVIGIAMNQTRYDGNYDLLQLRDGTTNHVNIYRGGSGHLMVRRGGTTLATTAAPVWPSGGLDVWKYIEFVTTIHNTAGSYELWIDGVQMLAATNVDTQDGSNAYANRLYFIGYGNDQWRFDDMYIGDTRLGDRRVVTLDVTSDSAVAWTRSTGSNNYATVDDNPLSATDYNEATAASLRDQFGMANLSYTPQSIECVAVNYVHNKQDSGARTIRAGIVSGGSTGNGATVSPVLSTDRFRQDIFATDPNTGSAWTKSGVDAAEPFYETVT